MLLSWLAEEMSILLGPYEESGEPEKRKGKGKSADNEELFIFGYACKLYRDDVKAVMEDSGQLLIPWMGDTSLMVDRYDVRNRLDDKSQFGLKPNFPHRMSAKEAELEEELDRERYLALEWDDIRVEEQEEEEKRRKASGFAAVGFTYESSASAKAEPAAMNSNMSLPEHPPTSCVDDNEEDAFIPPPGLIIPEEIQPPATNKLHSIIEKTASFVSKQGTQMEIIIKAKQKFNPFFSFLNYEDALFPYYTHIKDMIQTGAYVPQNKPMGAAKGVTNGSSGMSRVNANQLRDGASNEQKKDLRHDLPAVKISSPKHGDTNKELNSTESDSDDSDSDDGGYLHPLLMKASLKSSKPSTPEPAPSPPVPPSRAPPPISEKKLSVEELMNLHNKSSFVARSLAINSAPSLNQDMSTHGQATPSPSTYSEADAMAAYEHYKQQYYDSSSMSTHQDSSYGYYHQPDPSLSPHDAYHQQMYGGTPYSDQQPPYYGHFPHPIPPADLRPVVDKTAEYVAKNSDDFERTVLERHIGDARFQFLNPWDQYHNYYQAMKQYNRARLKEQAGVRYHQLPPMPLLASAQQEQEALKKPNLQKLSSSGTVSFKLQAKAGPSSVGLATPCSEFSAEEYAEETSENSPLQDSGGVGESADDKVDGVELPPVKKQRLENGGNNDHIENAVQEFLSMVKSEVGGSEGAEDQEEEEGMGKTVEAFLSTVKGMLGSGSSN